MGAAHSNAGDVVAKNGGFFTLVTTWPNESFAFVAPDAGIAPVTFSMSSAQRSQPQLVPLSDTTFGLVWTDGQLKRAVVECVP